MDATNVANGRASRLRLKLDEFGNVPAERVSGQWKGFSSEIETCYTYNIPVSGYPGGQWKGFSSEIETTTL